MEPGGEEGRRHEMLHRPRRPNGPTAHQREADPAGREPLAGGEAAAWGPLGRRKGRCCLCWGSREESAKGTTDIEGARTGPEGKSGCAPRPGAELGSVLSSLAHPIPGGAAGLEEEAGLRGGAGAPHLGADSRPLHGGLQEAHCQAWCGLGPRLGGRGEGEGGDPIPRGCSASTEGIGQRPAWAQPPSWGGGGERTADRDAGWRASKVFCALFPRAQVLTHKCLRVRVTPALASSAQPLRARLLMGTSQQPAASLPPCRAPKPRRERLLHSLGKKKHTKNQTNKKHRKRVSPKTRFGFPAISAAQPVGLWPQWDSAATPRRPCPWCGPDLASLQI